MFDNAVIPAKVVMLVKFAITAVSVKLPSASMSVGSGSAGASDPTSASNHGNRQDDSFPDWFFAAQAEVGPTSLPPYLPIPYSPRKRCFL